MPDQEYNLLKYRLEQAEKHITDLEGEVKAMREEAEKRERNRLIWGIGALGSVVGTLFAVIWAYRSVIFK